MENNEQPNGLKKFLDILGKIVAIVLLVILLLDNINASYGVMPSEFALVVMFAKQWGILILASITTLEAAVGHNFILLILALLAIAANLIFLFMPGTIEGWVSQVESLIKDATAALA